MDAPTITDRDALTEKIIGCAIAVHTALGPGLLESIYRDCMSIEMRAEGLQVESERSVGLRYRASDCGPTQIDLVVQDLVVVEVKAVERLHPVHLAQVITYLKLAGYPVGLLVNFNATSVRNGLRRLVHPDHYVKRDPPQTKTQQNS
jgi:GxxExxY protein